MYKYINDSELNEKYNNDDKARECVLALGVSPTYGCMMYIDFNSKKEKEYYKKMNSIGLSLLDEITAVTNQYFLNGILINIEIDSEFDCKVREAVEHKRQGRYLEAIECYKEIYNKCGLSEALCMGLYKTFACAGLIGFALELLTIAISIAQTNNNQYLHFNDCKHFESLMNFANDEDELFDYLRSLSGNENYESKMPYEYLKDCIIMVVKKYQR